MINVTKSDLPPLENYVEYLNQIWDTRWLTNNGKFVQLFESKLKQYLGFDNLLSVNNGTLAIQIALKVLDLKGEIITTPFTFAATTNAILWEGLTPVFADIDPETFNIDPADVEKKITDNTSSILAVHTYGNPCYVEELHQIAEEHDLKLIYDAAHAFGVEYKNESVLNWGDISTLSFHATKVFHTIEGGAIANRNKDLLLNIKLLVNHGIESEEKIVAVGTNAKMNEFQAAMGLCNLEDIESKIKQRKLIYQYYKEVLENTNVKFQKIIASKYNYSYMPVCFNNSKERDEVYQQLIRQNIKPRKYFYPLTSDFEYFKNDDRNLAKMCNLNNASMIASRVLCLPLYPDLEMEYVNIITSTIRSIVK